MMGKMQESPALHGSKDADLLHSGVEIKDPSADIEHRGEYDGDEDHLARLGKKQVLKVRNHRLRLMQLPC